MRRWFAGLAATGLLTACADRLPVDDSGHRTALPPSAAPAPAPPVAPPQAPPPRPPAPADTCGAAELGYLVGKSRTEIPVPTDLTRRRVVCESCPMTQDARPDRQTIFYDQASGKVTRLTCG